MRHWLSYQKALRCRHIHKVFNRLRLYSTKHYSERVSVPCQSNGSITVDLHHPGSQSLQRNASTNVLIYLPHGPNGYDLERDASNISTLRSHLACPIARINYRLNAEHRYPTPIHDVLTGYEWLIDNLLPKRGITRVGRSESIGQFAVCGEHIGGSLATALALTECRIGQPGIVAAAVSNPIVDWIAIDHHANPKAEAVGLRNAVLGNETVSLELLALRDLRAKSFRKPEHYFDPFASPILFFRSAGAEVPRAPRALPTDDLEQLSLLEREDYDRENLVRATEEAVQLEGQIDRRGPALRKASRRFPSKALGLRLPQFFIATGTTSPLRPQADELAKVLRQSFVRQSKDSVPGHSEFGRRVLMDDELDDEDRALAAKQIAEAAKKVEMHVHDGPGRYGDGPDGEAGLNEMAKWLRDKPE